MYIHIYNTYGHTYSLYMTNVDTHIFIYDKCFAGFSQSEFLKNVLY